MTSCSPWRSGNTPPNNSLSESCVAFPANPEADYGRRRSGTNSKAAAKMGSVQQRIRQSCRIVIVAAQLLNPESLAGRMAARINR